MDELRQGQEVAAFTTLAWIHSSHADANFRDKDLAVRAGKAAVDATRNQDADALDAYAAALASVAKLFVPEKSWCVNVATVFTPVKEWVVAKTTPCSLCRTGWFSFKLAAGFRWLQLKLKFLKKNYTGGRPFRSSALFITHAR